MSTSDGILRELRDLRATVNRLQSNPRTKFKGTQAGDFTTTTLPRNGDYGYQTTANELQMNCNGTIRQVGMTAV